MEDIVLILSRECYSNSIALEIDPRKVALLKQLTDIIVGFDKFTVKQNSKGGYNYTIDVNIYEEGINVKKCIFLCKDGGNFGKLVGGIDPFNIVDDIYRTWNRNNQIERVLTN